MEAIEHIWPVVSFIVLGSIMVHGFSAAAMSIWGHLTRHPKRRASVAGGETDGLTGMVHDDDGSAIDEEAFKSESSEEEDVGEGNGAIRVG